MWQLACIALTFALAIGLSGLSLVAILGLTSLLDMHGPAIGAVTLGGALLFGSSLALSPPVSGFVAGLVLLLERKLKVGDWISAAGIEGSIRRISLRAVEVQTSSNGCVIIPNPELVKGTMTRWSTEPTWAGRIAFTVPVSLGSDPDRVMKVIMRAATATPGLPSEPAPQITLEEVGSSALHFGVCVFATSVADTAAIASRLKVEILQALRTEGIEIPREQRDIHLRDLDGVRQAVAAIMAERRKNLTPDKGA